MLLTGSRVYGTPRPDSDTDVVVLMTRDEIDALETFLSVRPHVGEVCSREEYGYDTSPMTATARVGDVNLPIVTTEKQYEVWERGTQALLEEAPVSRERAVEVFQALQKALL